MSMATPTAAPQTDPAAIVIHQLRFARGSTMRVLEGIPADKLLTIPALGAGGTCAHNIIWIMGHMASTDDYFLKELGAINASALPESWEKLFGGGSKAENDASRYPSADALRQAMKEQHDKLVGWFGARSAKELAAPMPEKWVKYAPTLADCAFFLAWHEGYHAGQISVLRKAFGLAPAFG